ncbi:hypothetical protein [Pseudoroseicyclus aestuarii]|uniref:Uncharacterized protein n=1 Tax=Pseudoroseicyclus aestuarii TaxID=1795041 RepID=A0A318SMW7_9RHOB|nr:hypothetical protein [Pseudoroseicyclus aestuarii]PYE81410.1 hypothetical protein DFP88_10689 [Pseudoroseicyclus aestuarii]
MQALIWIGAAVTLVGLCTIIWSGLKVMRLRRADLPDDEFRARLLRVLPINIGALFTSFMGLMLVVVGVVLT